MNAIVMHIVVVGIKTKRQTLPSIFLANIQNSADNFLNLGVMLSSSIKQQTPPKCITLFPLPNLCFPTGINYIDVRKYLFPFMQEIQVGVLYGIFVTIPEIWLWSARNNVKLLHS